MGFASASTRPCWTSSNRIAFRKKLYRTIAELQADLDEWLRQYNEVRTHQGRWCYGKTPIQTFLDSLPMARENLLDQQSQPRSGRLLSGPVRGSETHAQI